MNEWTPTPFFDGIYERRWRWLGWPAGHVAIRTVTKSGESVLAVSKAYNCNRLTDYCEFGWQEALFEYRFVSALPRLT